MATIKSIEEKAKAYDKAIEKLRDFYRDYDTVSCLIDVKEELEHIFPELKESRDEKIWKWLIEVVEEVRKANPTNAEHNGMCSEAIALLEKQGEQKTLFNNTDNLIDNTLEDSWHKLHDALHKVPELEKQGEQKPTWSERGTNGNKREIPNSDWSEEDEINYNYALAACKYYGEAKGYADTETHQKTNNWLKSLKERVQLQPKQEWSEEDEEMYKEVLTDIIYAKNDMEAKECLGLSKRAMKAFNWFSKRYKSLRPQNTWKPSKEQIMALRWVLNHISYDSHKEEISGLLDKIVELK